MVYVDPVPSIEVPKQYQNFDAFKQAFPLTTQNQQLQMKIFEASKGIYGEFLGILFSSEMQERTIILDEDDDEGTKTTVISHVPNNIMRCPVTTYKLTENGTTKTIPESDVDQEDVRKGNIEVIQCDKEVNMLPYKIKMDELPKPYCTIHNKWMKWTSWNPPMEEVGFKESVRFISSMMSESISNSTLPDELDVVIQSIGFAEGLQETIYENADSWIHNINVFLGEGFWYTLENAIILNIQSAMYKGKTKLVEKMIKSWEVHEDVSGQKQGVVAKSVSGLKGLIGI